MSRFTTRIELYGSPSFEDYKKLHDAMQSKGFSKTISTESGSFMLPSAEYSFEKDNTTKEVLGFAKSTAASVWIDYAVLVTRTEVTREWHNLKKA